jgi:hypothetical protein
MPCSVRIDPDDEGGSALERPQNLTAPARAHNQQPFALDRELAAKIDVEMLVPPLDISGDLTQHLFLDRHALSQTETVRSSAHRTAGAMAFKNPLRRL